MRIWTCFFTYLFLLSTPVLANEGFGVFWWNIEKGITNQNTENDALNRNLRKLAESSNAPDILILGEFEYDAIRVEILKDLRARYSEKFLHYNLYASDTGIAIYAKKGIHVESFPLKELEWTPNSQEKEPWLAEDHEAFLYDRYYLRFRFTHGREVLNVVPVHLLMPWLQIKNRHSSFIGKVVVGMELLFGKKNPLAVQAENLRKALEADFGPELNREPLVLVGDFNVPKSIGRIMKTKVYRTLFKKLKPAFKKEVRTFPSKESESFGKYPELHLDHAFGSKGVEIKGAAVLELQGSDHYPISMTAREVCEGLLKKQ